MPRRPKLTPGFDGRYQPALKEVDDPYEPGAKLQVVVNACGDVLWDYFSRGHIDQAQYTAGQHFLWLKEKTEDTHGLAVDPTKEPVDTSFIYRGISQSRAEAYDKLKELEEEIGRPDYLLLSLIIYEGVSISATGGRLRERLKLMRRFVDVLEKTVQLWGYGSRKAG